MICLRRLRSLRDEFPVQLTIKSSFLGHVMTSLSSRHGDISGVPTQAAIILDSIFGNDKLPSTSRHMNADCVKSAKYSRATKTRGFTLLELLVVLGAITVLIIVQVPVLAGGKSQSKIAMCASHVRQIACLPDLCQ